MDDAVEKMSERNALRNLIYGGGHARPNPHPKMRAVSSQTTQDRIRLEWLQFLLLILTKNFQKKVFLNII